MRRRFAITLAFTSVLAACAHNAPERTTQAADGSKAVNAAARATRASQTTNAENATKPGREANGEAGVALETAIVRTGALPQLVSGYGSIAGGANAKASLAFSEAGRIANVAVSIGDRVGRGSLLARLDPRGFQIEADEARANLAAARATQSKARLGVRPQQAAQTDVQIRQARTQLSLAQAQLERESKLFSYGIAAQVEVDTARAALATAQDRLDVLRLQHSSEARPWQPDVDVADAGVAQAQSALSATEQKVALTQLVAPFAGIVVARMHNDGESVDANVPVIEIANDAAPIFTAQFAPADAEQVHRGDPATIEAQGTRVRAAGEITAIDPAQSDAHTVAVLIRIHASSVMAAFGPGAYGKASVRVGTRRGLIVPEPAIVSDAATGAVVVFRKNAGRFDPVPITVQARVGGEAIVDGPGLRMGDRVATKGAYELLTPAQASKKDTD